MSPWALKMLYKLLHTASADKLGSVVRVKSLSGHLQSFRALGSCLILNQSIDAARNNNALYLLSDRVRDLAAWLSRS